MLSREFSHRRESGESDFIPPSQYGRHDLLESLPQEVELGRHQIKESDHKQP